MAKDRAHDSRRVFQNPISHVKVKEQSQRYTETDDGVTRSEIDMKGKDRPKYDAFGKTDFERESAALKKESNLSFNQNVSRTGPGNVWPRPESKVPVVKIKS